MASRLQPAVFVGIKGTVVALDRLSGRELWRAPLKGSGFVILSLENGLLLATTRGEVWCVDPSTGRVLWHNPLKGLGMGLATFASAGGVATAIAAAAEIQRQQNDAASAAVIASSTTA